MLWDNVQIHKLIWKVHECPSFLIKLAYNNIVISFFKLILGCINKGSKLFFSPNFLFQYFQLYLLYIFKMTYYKFLKFLRMPVSNPWRLMPRPYHEPRRPSMNIYAPTVWNHDQATPPIHGSYPTPTTKTSFQGQPWTGFYIGGKRKSGSPKDHTEKDLHWRLNVHGAGGSKWV